MQMSYEMPFYIFWQTLMLATQLLLLALTEYTLSFLVGCHNIFIGMKLADSHEFNIFWQLSTHLCQVTFHIIFQHNTFHLSYCCSYSGLSFCSFFAEYS